MKVLLIGFSTLPRMPYAKFYLDALRQTGHEIHLLYWNRDGIESASTLPGVTRLHEFLRPQVDQVAKLTKVSSFLAYRHYVKGVLRENSFSFLVIMPTMPGILLIDELVGHFRGRFVLDMRDVTFERYRLFRWLIALLVRNSRAVFVSSDAFRRFLPRVPWIYTSHNLDDGLLSNRHVRRCFPREVTPIRVRFWGIIRHEKVNRCILGKLANDPRFEVHYHGVEEDVARSLKRFCDEIGAQNIFFHGAYLPNERYRFAHESDVLLNVYDNDMTMMNAMGNKFYDGVGLYLPQLCAVGSSMGDMVTAAGVGLAVDPQDPGFNDVIATYYRDMNWPMFEAACDQLLSQIVVEHESAKRTVARLIDEG